MLDAVTVYTGTKHLSYLQFLYLSGVSQVLGVILKEELRT